MTVVEKPDIKFEFANVWNQYFATIAGISKKKLLVKQ